MSPIQDMVKIGDFARMTNTNLRTLRYYEEIGLLKPALRSDGGFRYYRQTDANRVQMIRDLQDLGLQLERIGELLKTREDSQDRAEWIRQVENALREQRHLIEERIESLQTQKKQIGEALAKLEMPDELPMRHRSPHFGHIFSSEGYSAGYYGYMWADVLTADAAEAFGEAPGGFYDKDLAKNLVDNLFAPRNSIDPADAYRAFRGLEAEMEALMRDRGFPVPGA